MCGTWPCANKHQVGTVEIVSQLRHMKAHPQHEYAPKLISHVEFGMLAFDESKVMRKTCRFIYSATDKEEEAISPRQRA